MKKAEQEGTSEVGAGAPSPSGLRDALWTQIEAYGAATYDDADDPAVAARARMEINALLTRVEHMGQGSPSCASRGCKTALHWHREDERDPHVAIRCLDCGAVYCPFHAREHFDEALRASAHRKEVEAAKAQGGATDLESKHGLVGELAGVGAIENQARSLHADSIAADNATRKQNRPGECTEQEKIPEQNGETSAPVQADTVTYGPDDRRALSGSRSSAGRPGPESAVLPPSDVTVPVPATDGRFICGTCFGSGAGDGPRGARGWCKSCGGDGTVHEEAKAHRRTVGTANPSPERLQILLDDAQQGCAKLIAERVCILAALGLLTQEAADAGLWEEEHVLAEIRRLRVADISCVAPCRPESTGSQRRCEAHDLPLYPDGWCKEGRDQ